MAQLHLVPPIVEELSPPSPIRVVLGVGHEMMRRSLLQLLDVEDGVDVIGEADDLSSTLRSVQRDRPDVLVFDHRAPDGSRQQAIREISAKAPDTQVVLLTMNDTQPFAELARDCGALGFVLKDHADSDLLPAIRAVARGEPYTSPQVGRSRRDSPR